MNSLIEKKEAAKLLGVSLRTLQRYINAGRLPICRISPGVIRIRPEDKVFVESTVSQLPPFVH